MLENLEAGGYDVEFVDNDPDDVTCSICLFVLREPMQAEQCGHRFCKSCVEDMLDRENNTIDCPEDRNTVKVFKDYGREREILNMLVKCSNYKYGCTFTKELRDLESHKEVCEFQTLSCPIEGCEDQVQRKFMDSHAKHKHNKDKFTILEKKLEQLQLKNKQIEDQNITLNQKMSAQNHEIESQNQKFHLLEKKLGHALQLLQIKCLEMDKQSANISDLNCKVDAQKQNIESQIVQIRLQNQEIASQNQKIKSKNVEVQFQNLKLESQNETIQLQANEIVALRNRLSDLEKTPSNQIFHPSYIWKINNFDTRLRRAESNINFQPLIRRFYTSQGYKLAVKIYLNGDEEEWNEWLTIHIGLEPGQFDDTLKWPMTAKITTSVICKGLEDYPRLFLFNSKDRDCRNKFRKPSDDFKGYSFRLLHVFEIEDYVVDNTLIFQIEVSHL